MSATLSPSLEQPSHRLTLGPVFSAGAKAGTESLQRRFEVDLRMSTKRSVGGHRNPFGLAIVDQFLLGKVRVALNLHYNIKQTLDYLTRRHQAPPSYRLQITLHIGGNVHRYLRFSKQ